MSTEKHTGLAFESIPSDRFSPKEIPEQMRITQGPGWAWVPGLPFLSVGLFCMVAPFLPVLSNMNRLSWQTVGWSLFGLAFAIPGAIMMFGRTGTVLNRKTWSVRRWWGLPFTIWRRTGSLDKFQHVQLERESGDGSDSFPVHLMGKHKQNKIYESLSYHQARVQAEHIATFLGWDLHDLSRGEAVVRAPASLQQSLRERLQHTDAAPRVSARPKDAKAACRVDTGSLSLDIPPLGHDAATRLVIGTGQISLLLTLLGLAFMVTQASVAKSGSVGDYYMVMGITLTFTLLGLWMNFSIIRAGRKWAARTTSVYVDDQALRVLYHSTYEDESLEMEVDEWEELIIGQAQNGISWKHTETLIAHSDRKTLEFGLGLSREELKWLQKTIQNALFAQLKR